MREYRINATNIKGYFFLDIREYPNGRTALAAKDMRGLPFAKFSSNLPDHTMEEGEIAIKNYSENEGVLEELVRLEIVSPPHRTIEQGYVEFPVCKLLVQK